MPGFSPFPNRDNNSVGGKETHMRKVLAIAAVLSFSMTLVAADPIVGTWKLNVAKSQLHNPVQSYLMKIEQTAPNTYRCVFDVVTAQGEKQHQEIIRIGDGKKHPVEGLNAPAGVAEVVSPGLRKVVRTRNGKLVFELDVQFSDDEKTHTVTAIRTDASGNSYKDLDVFERQ
jgi:hypothetical protein